MKTRQKLNHQARIEDLKRRMNEFKQDKWMPYEKEIIKYYYPQLSEWLKTRMAKPSIIAFTSGLGRDIAGLMEWAKLLGIKEGKKLIIEEILTFLENVLIEGRSRQEYPEAYTRMKAMIDNEIRKLNQLKEQDG